MSTFVTVKEKTLARCRKMGSTIVCPCIKTLNVTFASKFPANSKNS